MIRGAKGCCLEAGTEVRTQVSGVVAPTSCITAGHLRSKGGAEGAP